MADEGRVCVTSIIAQLWNVSELIECTTVEFLKHIQTVRCSNRNVSWSKKTSSWFTFFQGGSNPVCANQNSKYSHRQKMTPIKA